MDKMKQQHKQLAKKDLLFARCLKLDTSHLLMSALNAVALSKAGCVWEEKEERVRCEMDQIKTTKDHHHQQDRKSVV
jgi:hypothetical protein